MGFQQEWKNINHIFLKRGFQSYKQDMTSQYVSQEKIAELEDKIDIMNLVSNKEEDTKS